MQTITSPNINPQPIESLVLLMIPYGATVFMPGRQRIPVPANDNSPDLPPAGAIALQAAA